MSAEVILIGGRAVASEGNPDRDVVAELEMLLEAARSGRMSGIAYAVDYSDNSSGSRNVGTCSRAQAGALFGVLTRITHVLDT